MANFTVTWNPGHPHLPILLSSRPLLEYPNASAQFAGTGPRKRSRPEPSSVQTTFHTGRTPARECLPTGEIRATRSSCVGDLSTYFPLPGSSPRLIMLVGPSVTWGSQKYLQLRFGVTPSESVLSTHPVFRPTAGVSASGLGTARPFS